MNIDLRLPSGERDRDEDQHDIDNMLDNGEKMHNGDSGSGSMDLVADVVDGAAGEMNTSTVDMLEDKEFMSIESLSGMEFEYYREAFSFYQDYARSVGFNTAIQNSRRSKTTSDFIDAKFACSRYGTKREYDKSFNRARSRQTNQDPDNGTSRRACAKTDCKASMHVKRRPDGKWVVHSFVKDHNHELFPAQAISEQTRKMIATVARQFAEYKNVAGLKNDTKSPFHRSQSMVLESGDAKILLEFFSQMQCSNSNFFYAVDLTEDQRLKNLFWVDGKSRHDYSDFGDVVSLDTTYIRNRYKMPLALIVGVNQHYQFMLLGCAIISDESAATYTWLMQTWLKAMGGQPPKAIITAHDKVIKSSVSEVFPGSRHFFCLWHIWGNVSEYLSDVIKGYDKFMAKFEKCVTRSWTNEDFDKRWWKLVDRCELKEDECMQSLYEDRSQWVPMFIQDTLLAGMCTVQRADSVNAFFDKYVHKKTSVQEFVKHYELILQERYEEESRADSDTWNKSPVLKSPSPFEKSVCGVYTHSVFKKFQSEVLGAVACHPKKEREEGSCVIFRVQDLDKTRDFVVTWNEAKLEISCSCRLFEYKGYLCRHALVVLQIRGLSTIPFPYILKRWKKDARIRHLTTDEAEQLPSRLQRYNAICQRAMKLSEEGSISQGSCSVAIRSIEEAFGNCMTINNSSKSLTEAGTSTSNIVLCMEDDSISRSRSMSMSMGKMTKKKNPTKKSKVSSHPEMMTSVAQESLQQMEKLSSRPAGMDNFYGSPQSVQGMVQLNLMAPTRDNFYGSQPSIQGLGQLNSIAPNHDGYYTPQPSLHGMGHMDFFRSASSYGYGIREDPNVRTIQQQQQQHEDASRHG